jgi:hypothetical protein
MRHQADGTQPPDPAALRTISEEDRRFLEAAMQEYAQEPVKRMQEIEKQLHEQAPGEEAVARQERLLEELGEICESLDFSRGAAPLVTMQDIRSRSLRPVRQKPLLLQAFKWAVESTV